MRAEDNRGLQRSISTSKKGECRYLSQTSPIADRKSPMVPPTCAEGTLGKFASSLSTGKVILWSCPRRDRPSS